MVNKPIRCDECRERIIPTFFGKNQTKVWTKYTTRIDKDKPYYTKDVCLSCYKKFNNGKNPNDFGLPS
tara:strand:+ start:403 stop:606 length:204 start_codon:yes stop_codon:yes gene_type:complete